MDIVIFISGSGTNLKAIIEYIKANQLNINIKAVVSNNPLAYGLEIAKNESIKTFVVPISNKNKEKNLYSIELLKLIEPLQPDLIVLAGFMKILSAEFIDCFPDKILNIHPSILPKYPGLNTHLKVLTNNDNEHGCTIHLVTKNLDAGPILAQAKFAVDNNDTIETLNSKVQHLEHELYPITIEKYLKSKHSKNPLKSL